MQSKPKSNSVITSRYDAERNVLVFTVLGCGDVELDLNKVHADNMRRAAIHGWNQRIPDAAAIGVTDKEGNVIPHAERTRIKYERMNDLCRHYESGTPDWSRRVTSAGGDEPGLIVAAFARVKGTDIADAEARIMRHAETMCGGDRRKALSEIAKSPKVRAAMDDIRAERAPIAAEEADALVDAM